MIKKSVILIPTIESANEICDFVFQTGKNLINYENNVYIISFVHAYSLKEILSGIFNKKKLKFVFIKDGIKFLTPIYLIPFRRLSIINKLNQIIYFFVLKFILRIKYYDNKLFLCWMFFPHLSHLLFLNFKDWQTIYDIVDFYTFFNTKKNKEIQEQKKFLLKKSNYAFSISQTLKIEYQKLFPKKILVSPQGFDEKIFSKKLSLGVINQLVKKKPVIGFIGKIDERLDFDLLQNLIFRKPEWQFVFVGPKKYENIISNKQVRKNVKRILTYGNVFWQHKIKRNQIPSLLQQFDVCIIPYDVSLKFNSYSYPMKVFEYLYAKKPIVSTEIRELKNSQFNNVIVTSNSYQKWIGYITEILSNPWPEKNKIKQFKLAQNNSWKNKIEYISSSLRNKEF